MAELTWRDFATALLDAHPDMATRPLRPEFERFPWRHDENGFDAWAHGQTGYPIVDAGMRQLWRTGYLPNRARLIVASFLVKHLLIDWRHGEEWFWDTLIDADPANNPLNWQWVAGAGVDSAPYFRIFNPVLQAEKFDPDGAYVRQWVPELARLEAPAIHSPWKASARCAGARGSDVGRDLSEADRRPCGQARARALDGFRRDARAGKAAKAQAIFHQRKHFFVGKLGRARDCERHKRGAGKRRNRRPAHEKNRQLAGGGELRRWVGESRAQRFRNHRWRPSCGR